MKTKLHNIRWLVLGFVFFFPAIFFDMEPHIGSGAWRTDPSNIFSVLSFLCFIRSTILSYRLIKNDYRGF